MQVNGLGVGDAVGICTNEDGDLVVESNSEEVQQATVRPTYGAAAVQHIPAPPPGKAESFSNGDSTFSLSCITMATCLHRVDMPGLPQAQQSPSSTSRSPCLVDEHWGYTSCPAVLIRPEQPESAVLHSESTPICNGHLPLKLLISCKTSFCQFQS